MEVHTNWIMLHFFANKHKREVGASTYVHNFVHCEMSHPTHIKNANEIRPLCAPNKLLLQLT